MSALTILYAIHGAFRTLIDEIGIAHTLPLKELVLFVVMIVVFQTAYWYRFYRLQMPQWQSIPVGHILGFASRLSFIFGGALFSLFFLRHAPELRSTAGALVMMPRIGILFTSLFCMYCFSLELDRLGTSLQVRKNEERRSHEETS